MNITLSNDLIWTYNWTGPTSVKQGTKLYYCGITSNGHQRVFMRDGSTVYANAILNTVSADDHSGPSLLAQLDKDVVAFYNRHDGDNLVRCKRASAGTLSFGAETTISFPSDVSYTQVLSDEDKVLLLVRCGKKAWYGVLSTDYAQTFGTPFSILDATSETGQCYMMTQPKASGEYLFAAQGHPTSGSWQDVGIGRINLGTGDISIASGVIANLDGTGLPLHKDDLDSVGMNLNTSQHSRMLDVGWKQGKFYGWYTKWSGDNIPKYYYFHQNSDGTITRVNSLLDAHTFAYANSSHYVGGVALDRNGNNIMYISEYTSGSQPWKIKQYTINSDMSVSSVDILIDSALPLVRPIAPVGENSVILQRLDTYTDYHNYSATAYERSRV